MPNNGDGSNFIPVQNYRDKFETIQEVFHDNDPRRRTRKMKIDPGKAANETELAITYLT